ncbi:MAG: signal peptide peptidase SppA [Armatimonadota bacterium]|nr:MAG: signal peptide peptidase SppA [Armatimonadota bacterium]
MDQQSQPPQWPTPAPQQPQPPAQRGMSAGAKWAIGCGAAVALAFLALLVIFIAGLVMAIGGAAEYGRMPGGNVALIRIEGAITAGAFGGGPFGQQAASERIVEQLQGAAEDKAIKAIVLRINSPGGSAAGSQEMYHEIQRICDQRRKPVFVSMGDVAASGGYYVASAADRIFADPGTITGSIGVISASLELSGLFDKIGIQPEVLKKGKFKDMGSGFRPMNADERQIFEQLLNDIYRQFVTAVAAGREMDKQEVLKLADGRVYTGEQAKELKLVDELGGLRETVRAAARKAGIPGKPKVVEYRKRTLMDVLFAEVRVPQPPTTGYKGLLYDRAADLITRGALSTEE